ncbi:hypothetical protein U0070_017136 [Myodes glareolus]|uniref:Uncharacterized protein n=1 Tax=Myodes glareolus TaxID=447135 RepID=A0AAW0HA37_MYOGA
MDDTADGVKMDAGEVTLVNHNSTFKTHLLPQSHFPEDQLSLSDQQILPSRQGTLDRPSSCSTRSAAYNPDYYSGPGLGVLARYSWGKMLTFGGHHGVTLMQIRHMAVAGFSSFINFQITPPQTVSLAQMTQEALVKVQMDSGETPLQHQSPHYRNPEIAEVFTSKPGRPQG